MSDYEKWVSEIGITEDEVQLLTNIDNVVEVDHSNYYKNKSKLHGIGVFASKNIKKGEVIGFLYTDNKYRTPLGRLTNHSKDKNARFYTKVDFCFWLLPYSKRLNMDGIAVAEKDIKQDEEILVNYRDHFKNFPYKKILHELKHVD